MKFFLGWHGAGHLALAHVPLFISVNRLWNRRRHQFRVGDWIMDSGAFSLVTKHGGYPDDRSVEEYAKRIRKFAGTGNLLAAVAQDYMCEPFVLEKTGLTVKDHQRLTIERYDALMACDVGGVYIMPVLQGYEPEEYADHVRQYGDRLAYGAYVGVGSVCKRNASPSSVVAVLRAIKRVRPDLRLHGFGLKKTCLADASAVDLLESADSMAWSYDGRRKAAGLANCPNYALTWRRSIAEGMIQRSLF